MEKTSRIILWVLSLGFSSGLVGQTTQYGASFLEIGVGARALAMGGSHASVGGETSSFLWNPAGLAFVDRTRISGMYGPQFGSLRDPLGTFHYLGFAQPIRPGAVLAVNWIRLSIDDIPIYSELQGSDYWDRLHNRSLRPTGDPEGFIRDREDAFTFSFAMKQLIDLDLGWAYHHIRIELPLGVNFKWIRHRLGPGEATGLGIDLGAMVRVHLSDLGASSDLGILTCGCQLQDLTRTKLSWNTRHEDVVPMNVKWGLSYSLRVKKWKADFILSYDRDSRWGTRNHWGLEYAGFGVFALRLGFDTGKLTAGAGLNVWVFRFDYAFLSHDLDSLHRVGCTISL